MVGKGAAESKPGMETLRRQIADQEAYVEQLERRRVARDELLQQVRRILRTHPREFYEIEAIAYDWLHVLESIVPVGGEEAPEAPVEDPPTCTMEELIGLEEEGEEEKKSPAPKEEKTRKHKHVDVVVAETKEEADTNLVLRRRNEKEERDRQILFDTLDQIQFEIPAKSGETATEEPDWLKEDTEDYEDDFEDVDTDVESLSLSSS